MKAMAVCATWKTTILLPALAGLLLALPARGADEAQQWDVFETSFKTGKSYTNAFADVEVNVVFRKGDKQWVVPAFWTGGKKWTVRFAPPEQGEYTYRPECSDKANAGLNGPERRLQVSAYRGNNPLLQHGFLGPSRDQRHLAHADGTPFFWLGDTWWKGLCRRLTWEGFQQLTADRKAKGFSVVQIVCGPYPDEGLFETRWENEGGKPYLTRDFSVVNPKYFEYADRRIRHLVENGIVPAIVGGWGRGDCNGMAMAGVAGLKRHWRNIIARYGAYPAVWILGGESGGPQWTEVGAYVRDTDPYRHPTMIHPLPPRTGRQSVTDASVVNVNMLQTGHGDWPAARGAVPQVQKACAQQPLMPVVVGECCYEGHMQTAFQDVQRYLFWTTLLNGAAGMTYGAAGIWHASIEGDPGIAHVYDWTTWEQGMNYPGSAQLGLGKRLLEQYPWAGFEPHPEWAEEDCFAAGIPGEVRFLYQPRRNIYNWTGTVVKKLEPEVPYHAFYFDPATARRFDAGTVEHVPDRPAPINGHTAPLLVDERFDGAEAGGWKDVGTPTRREQGRLVGGKGLVTICDRASEKDLMASVDANSDAEAGIILRFRDTDNYLVGLYSPSLKAIFLHDRANGDWGPMLGSVAVPEIGPHIRLTVAASGDHAALVLTDGVKTYRTPAVKVAHTTAGKTGLWLYQIGERQAFDNYAVSATTFAAPPARPSRGVKNMTASDEARITQLPSPQDWVLVLQRAGVPEDFIAAQCSDDQGHTLPYRLFVPRGYDATRKYPLVLYLHGAGGRGTDNLKQLIDVPQIMALADPANQRQRPCFIVAPQCPEDQQWANMPWNAATGVGKFTAITWPLKASVALLDDLARRYPGIDTSAISIIGPSMGGYGTWDAVCRFPGKFRNAVPICGGGDPVQVARAAGLGKLRLWAYHCVDDPVVPVGRSREMLEALKALKGTPPRYTEYPQGGHDAYSRALTDAQLHQWLFEAVDGR